MNFSKVVFAAESGFMWIRKLLISEVRAALVGRYTRLHKPELGSL